jgi:hypothetical protein
MIQAWGLRNHGIGSEISEKADEIERMIFFKVILFVVSAASVNFSNEREN